MPQCARCFRVGTKTPRHPTGLRTGVGAERSLVAGRCTEMSELFRTLEEVSGIPAPSRQGPFPLLYVL